MVECARARRRADADRIGAALLGGVLRVCGALAQRPEMGAPMAVVFRDDQCFPIRGVHDTAWRSDRALTAGGTLIEHGVHDLDLLTWLFGPVARLRAWQQNRAGHRGVEDYVAVEIEFDTGLRAQLVNCLAQHAAAPVQSAPGGVLRQRLSRQRSRHGGADRRAARRRPRSRSFRSTRSCADSWLIPPGRSTRWRAWFGIPYLLQDLCFVESLLADRAPAPDIRAGLEAQRLVEAVYAAARSGEEIEVARFDPCTGCKPIPPDCPRRPGRGGIGF